ncbi:MAG: hypothetical protein H5U32_03620 [Pseudomonas balearica]|jgi:hypothetical protein|uniref:hypothetical protein n=1 Tax=Stutzerimonas balearica TaxID=74829 RepID=UPI0019C99D8E|nr:hypothetical protein [Stutzerimonas balearica]MBC7198319.1 hypothetical protein [Stutzerimonas balearica]
MHELQHHNGWPWPGVLAGMMAMLQVTQTEVNGTVYYTTTARGVAYTLRRKRDGEWELSSRRLSLGRHNVGTTKFFASLNDLEASIKALRGIAALLNDAASAGATRH